MHGVVVIRCSKCGEPKTIYLIGGWDIEKVVHVCGEPWRITFAPPRAIY